jgi:cytochrome c oxidase subunit 2
MTGKNRLRWLIMPAVTAFAALVLAGCGPEYPNTTFAPLSELGEKIDHIWDVLLLWGMIVFVLVELALIYIVVRFRHRENAPEPKQTHGNTKLEIVWTMIPAFILLMIAVPTVRTIFETQSDPPANALQIDVRGHQWWWEFEYPEFGIKTANELYLPNNRPVSLNLQTHNVLHSFWIPRLAGKRDAVNRRVNRIWFTVNDSVANQVFNGFCAEYCGASHANMLFRVFVVNETDFGAWAAHQRGPAVFPPPAPPGAQSGAAAGGQAPNQAAADSAAAQAAPAPVYEFPRERIPDYAVPRTRYPASIPFDDNLTGDPTRGMQAFNDVMAGGCIACHAVLGNPMAVASTAPNLTHFGSRTTFAGALYPATREYLARWVKNAWAMKPGSIMPTQGAGLVYPPTGIAGKLTDQQIADIVAYLMALK